MNAMTVTVRAHRIGWQEGARAFAILAALLLASTAQAQTIPYQSSMRGTVGTGPGQEALPRGGVFQPRVEAAAQYVDNINLVESGQDQVNAYGLELAPGFYASYSSDSAIAAIDYSVIGRVWNESDENSVSQRMAANGSWVAVPNLFSLQGQASISDAVINPQDGLNYGGLGIFGQDNLSEQAAASLTPILRRRFNDFEFLAQYSYGRVWYFDQGSQADQVGFVGQDDSIDQNVNVAFGTAEDTPQKLTGQVFYDWQHSSYQDALPYEFERLGLNAGWRLAETLSLVGDVGAESDLDKSTTQGGLDNSFWSAGFLWEPDDRTSAEARYGDRFFGHTYFFSLRRQSRVFGITATYDESPQVYTRILSLGSFTPGELPPGMDPGDFGRLNGSPYVGKDGRLTLTAIGSRTKLSLSGFWSEQNYIRSELNDDTYYGGSFDASRQLASNLSIDLSVSYMNYEQNQSVEGSPTDFTTTHSDDTQFVLHVNRNTGARLMMSLEAGYLNSSGSDVDYDGWWTGLRATWTP